MEINLTSVNLFAMRNISTSRVRPIKHSNAKAWVTNKPEHEEKKQVLNWFIYDRKPKFTIGENNVFECAI